MKKPFISSVRWLGGWLIFTTKNSYWVGEGVDGEMDESKRVKLKIGGSGWRAACLDCEWFAGLPEVDLPEGRGQIEGAAERHVNEEGVGYGHTAILIGPDGGMDHIIRSRWGEAPAVPAE